MKTIISAVDRGDRHKYSLSLMRSSFSTEVINIVIDYRFKESHGDTKDSEPILRGG